MSVHLTSPTSLDFIHFVRKVSWGVREVPIEMIWGTNLEEAKMIRKTFIQPTKRINPFVIFPSLNMLASGLCQVLTSSFFYVIP